MSEEIQTSSDKTSNGDTHGMMVLALQNKADPAVLSRLMDLQDRYDAMQARKAYIEAMTAFKKSVPNVLRKDATVDFGKTHYTHATLGGIIDQITSGLSAQGLSASWETAQATGSVTVTCHITHLKGHRESVSLTGPRDDSCSKNPIQQIGSSVTYLQRYTLLAALGLATSDQDDADQPGRQPVKMPVAKATVVEAKPEPKPEPKTITVEEGENADDNKVVVGQLLNVAVKESRADSAKKWKKWGLKINEDWYSTFDHKIGEAALTMQSKMVRVEYEVDAKGFNAIKEFGLADEGEAATPVESTPF